jgi:hypothetical protein
MKLGPPTRDDDLSRMVRDIHAQLGHNLDRPPALLTEVEAAAVLHQAPRTLQAWRYSKSKTLLWRKIGGTVLYRAHDLAAFIEGQAEGVPE